MSSDEVEAQSRIGRGAPALRDLEGHSAAPEAVLRQGADEGQDELGGDDALICLLGGGFTPVEQTLYESGRQEAVMSMRKAFQDAMESRMREEIERLVGRKVVDL